MTVLSAAALRLANWRLFVLQLPLRSEIRWVAHSERHIDTVLLEITLSNGASGLSEMAVRPKWHGEDVAGLLGELHNTLLPQLVRVDFADDDAIADLLTKSRSALARALVDMAREDILAQVAALPLHINMARGLSNRKWQDGATGRKSKVPFSCTITRAHPDIMVREASRFQSYVDARAFKIKTGQGYGIDKVAVAAIRDAAGADVVLSVDSNSAGPPNLVAQMSEMIALHDVRWYEDPCRLQADAGFLQVKQDSSVPVLVDNACRSLPAARQFLSLGAQGLSIKIMKTGIAESLAIAKEAAQGQAQVTLGLCASTSLSAMYSFALSAALPDAWQAMPCEDTFFVNLAHDITGSLLAFENGAITLPKAGPLAEKIDWSVVERHTIHRLARD